MISSPLWRMGSPSRFSKGVPLRAIIIASHVEFHMNPNRVVWTGAPITSIPSLRLSHCQPQGGPEE